MNFSLVRADCIKKLEDKLSRVTNALKNYPYKNKQDIIDDFVAFERIEKELQIQKAFQDSELKAGKFILMYVE
jgi:hypothetical protein